MGDLARALSRGQLGDGRSWPNSRPQPRTPCFISSDTTPSMGRRYDHLLRLWGVDTLVICGTLANICVHYTAASAALRWYAVVIPRDAISALEPFDLETTLRQAAFVFAGRVTTADGVRCPAGALRSNAEPMSEAAAPEMG